MPSTLLHPAPTRTRETGKTKRTAPRQAICDAALLIPGVVSCVPHPDPAYNHPLDLNRWLEVGFRYGCGCVVLAPVPEAGEDHLGFVRQTARACLGCPDEKTGKLLHAPRKCGDCWSDEDSARLRAINERLSPDALFATIRTGVKP